MHGVVESGERVGGAAPGRRCSAHHALSLRHPKGQCVFEACIKPATVTLEDAVSRFTSAAVRGSGKRVSRHPGLAQARSVRLASLPPSSRSLPPTIFPTLKRASPQNFRDVHPLPAPRLGRIGRWDLDQHAFVGLDHHGCVSFTVFPPWSNYTEILPSTPTPGPDTITWTCVARDLRTPNHVTSALIHPLASQVRRHGSHLFRCCSRKHGHDLAPQPDLSCC